MCTSALQGNSPTLRLLTLKGWVTHIPNGKVVAAASEKHDSTFPYFPFSHEKKALILQLFCVFLKIDQKNLQI